MAVRDIFKVNRKTFFNPTAWIGLDSLIFFNRMFKSVFSSMFKPAEPASRDSFEDAVKKYGLTEADITDGVGTYQALALVFVLMGLVAIVYALYLLFFSGSFTGAILGLAVAAFLLVQGFRFDFWSLQMRKRRLGLNFSDWKNHYFGG